MQRDIVDMYLVGTDRNTKSGDVCIKMGIYLKSLTAHDNSVPFYICAPSAFMDYSIDDGLKEIPVKMHSGHKVRHSPGRTNAGEIAEVNILPAGSSAGNDAFDVTPAAFVSALVAGLFFADASRVGITAMFPER